MLFDECVSLNIATMLTFNSGFSFRGGSAYRKNGVIYFDIGINCTALQSAGTSFTPFTVNSGYRPKTSASACSQMASARIQIDGTVALHALESNSIFWIAGSYLV